MILILVEKIDCENCISFYASVRHNLLNLVIFKGRKLYYSNTFEYQTKEDLLYYILFASKQVKVVNSQTKITFLREKKLKSVEFEYLRKFIKNIEVTDEIIN